MRAIVVLVLFLSCLALNIGAENLGIGYTISGNVRYNGAGLSGVVVTLSGSRYLTSTTSSGGLYSFSNLPAGGTYTMTPTKSGYSFTPASQTFSNLSANQTLNFTAMANTQCVTATFSDTTVNSGSTVYVDINLDNFSVNQTSVAGIQFSLTFTNSYGFTPGNAVTTPRSQNFSISTSIHSNIIDIIMFSSSGTLISSGTGAVCRIPFRVVDNIVGLLCSNLSFTQFLLSDAQSQSINCCYSDQGRLCSSGCELCDTNNDGAINIFDIVKSVNCILGRDNCTSCADYNGDNTLNIFDIVSCVNQITGGNLLNTTPGSLEFKIDSIRTDLKR